MTPYQRRKIRLTNMLITIVAVYLICNIAKVINEITKLLIGKTFTEIVTVTNFLVTFNSSVNYLIYCAFGRTFRQSFVNLFLKCGNQVCNCSACLSARHQQRNNTTAVDNQTYSDCSNCRSSVSSAPSKLCSTVRYDNHKHKVIEVCLQNISHEIKCFYILQNNVIQNQETRANRIKQISNL